MRIAPEEEQQSCAGGSRAAAFGRQGRPVPAERNLCPEPRRGGSCVEGAERASRLSEPARRGPERCPCKGEGVGRNRFFCCFFQIFVTLEWLPCKAFWKMMDCLSTVRSLLPSPRKRADGTGSLQEKCARGREAAAGALLGRNAGMRGTASMGSGMRRWDARHGLHGERDVTLGCEARPPRERVAHAKDTVPAACAGRWPHVK